MPPKTKKKRPSLTLNESGEIQPSSESVVEEKTPPVRQVVEVVQENDVPDAIETIKKDAEEIEEAVSTIEEKVSEEVKPIDEGVRYEATKGNVESLFVKSQTGVSPEITVVGKKTTPLGVWVGAMLGVALAVGLSLVLLVKGPPITSFIGAKPTSSPTPTMVPTPSPVLAIRTDIKVNVLNGGGTPGAGGRMKAFLESKGYNVVSVGNTEEYTYEQTEILAKTGMSHVITLLTDDLKAEYTLGTSSASVEESADYDAQVIVGKEE